MPTKLKFKIKNWTLALLALVFFCLFTALGFWQLSRAHQKQLLLNAYTERTSLKPFSAKDLERINDWRFYRIQLKGTFDNAHTFLLDNKTYHGQIGYEVYTPFHALDMKTVILVDRGFIPLGVSRHVLPQISDIKGNVIVTGLMNLPPLYVTLGSIQDHSQISWPLRVEYINLAMLSKLLNNKFFPYVVSMEPHDPRAYAIEWQIVSMTPERHIGYAIQWFALALTLLILFVALNCSRQK